MNAKGASIKWGIINKIGLSEYALTPEFKR
jgi:hypothetical protein